MGVMMGAAGTTGAWIFLWTLLGVVLAVTGGVLVARVLSSRYSAGPRQIPLPDHRAGQKPGTPLRLRYVHLPVVREPRRGLPATAHVGSLFTSSAATSSAITGTAWVFFILGGIAAATAIQGLYERAFELEGRGARDMPRRLIWLAVLVGCSALAGWAGPGLRGAGGPVVPAVTGPVVLTGFWWFTSWFLLAGPVPGRRRHGRVLAGHRGSVLKGRECVPRHADDWRSRCARMPKRHAGSGPFVTLRVGEHPDGTTERRESRRHRKHMFAAPRHAAPRGGRRKIATAGSACCSRAARFLPGSARSSARLTWPG